jgi:hypothetical protein
LGVPGFNAAAGLFSSGVHYRTVASAVTSTMAAGTVAPNRPPACPSGQKCCGGVDDSGTCNGDCCAASGRCCVDQCCTGSESCCSGTCTDVKNDPGNCNSCGSACPAGYACCNGTCTNIPGDRNNCGACGRVCQAGQTCCGGNCVSPSSDPNNCGTCENQCPILPRGQEACCGGVCVSTWADPGNCGACGVTCPPNEQCFDGSCQCLGVEARVCSGVCMNIFWDSNNCGGCGNVCAPGTGCCGATCIDLTSDPYNCGACHTICSGPANSTPVCTGGTCQYCLAADVAGFLYQMDTACPCGSAVSPADYLMCVSSQAAAFVKARNLPSQCQQVVIQAAQNSSCGIANASTCCATAQGLTTCSIVSAGQCVPPVGGSANIGSTTSCYNACLPDCNSMTFTDDQINSAAQIGIQGIADPWSLLDLSIVRTVAQLGCGLSLGPAFPAVKRAIPTAPSDCDTSYCTNVAYCGPGNSGSNPNSLVWYFTRHVTDCLNRTCFSHDICYTQSCVSPGCIWSSQSDTCDQPFFTGSTSCIQTHPSFLDRVVKAVAQAIKNWHTLFPPGGCPVPPCSGSCAHCDPTAGTCAAGCAAGSSCCGQACCQGLCAPEGGCCSGNRVCGSTCCPAGEGCVNGQCVAACGADDCKNCSKSYCCGGCDPSSCGGSGGSDPCCHGKYCCGSGCN